MSRHFDPDLIRAYDVNGPRYTSYPTANLFSESVQSDALAAALAELPEAPALSLYVHVPFCATICYYCACNKIVTNNRRHAARYVEYLHQEIEMLAGMLPDGHTVEQLHFGGGTPTYLTDEQLGALFGKLNGHFRLQADESRDFSIEIDPRTVGPERIAHLTELGINRISLGIQDFDPDVQLAVNRLQSEADTAEVMAAARRHGVRSLSVDLIYGLPRQTVDRFSRTLEQIIALEPDRISLYSYAHLPQRFKTQRQIDASELPNAETKLALLGSAVEAFTRTGYVHIGMDHFARPEDALVRAQRQGGLHRNFQGYTTHGHCDLIGLGVSAISSVGRLYAQNAKTLDAYCEAIGAGQPAVERGLVLTDDDLMVRELIGELMCHFHLDIPAFEARWGVSFNQAFPEADGRLAGLAADGLVEHSPTALTVTDRGRFLIRNVAMVFDRYLPAQTTGFSKAI